MKIMKKENISIRQTTYTNTSTHTHKIHIHKYKCTYMQVTQLPTFKPKRNSVKNYRFQGKKTRKNPIK